jgi:Zn-dependent protease with chaperone function
VNDDMAAATIVAGAITVLFALVGPHLARRLPPATATRLLVPASLVVAGSGVWVLTAVAFTWVAQLGPVSRYGDWSAEELRADTPFPTTVAVSCGVLALLSVSRTATVGTRRARVLLAVRQSCRQVGTPGSLVVLDHERPDAFATPGASGRIVVTTGLLRALTAEERRALLAHEASHLAHRHAWWLLAANLADAANPLLTRTVRAIGHAVERWADEDAARAVTDRRLVARTLARTALLTRTAPPASARLAATGGDVPGRVRALLEPPPRPRVLPLAVLLVLLVACTVAAGTVQRRGDQLLDEAGKSAPAATHHTGQGR